MAAEISARDCYKIECEKVGIQMNSAHKQLDFDDHGIWKTK